MTVPVFSIWGRSSGTAATRRAESWMVWAYFAETLAYPYNNQRRVILVLPVVTIWYVVGAAAAGRACGGAGGAHLEPGGGFRGGGGSRPGRRRTHGGRIYEGLPVQRGPEELPSSPAPRPCPC